MEVGGGGVDRRVVICVPRGGCETVSIGWSGVNTIYGVEVGLGRSRYHTGMPKVNPERFRVVMTSLLMIPKGGKRKGMVCMGNEPQ